MNLRIQLEMSECSETKNEVNKENFEIGYAKYTLKFFECINIFSLTLSHITVVKNASPGGR